MHEAASVGLGSGLPYWLFLSQKPQIWLFLKAFGLRIFFWLFLAIVRICAELLLSKQCCRDFQVTAEMLQNFKSDIVYQSEFSDEISLFD